MKKFIVLSIVLLMLVGFAITSSAVTELELEEFTLFADQVLPVGMLTVGIEIEDGHSIEDGLLIVRYNTNPTGCEWELLETHLYVGIARPAKSAPGRFPYGPEYVNMVIIGVCFVEYFIPLTDFISDFTVPTTLYIAAQAEVTNPTENDPNTGEPPRDETAWADGIQIRTGKNWAMYFTVVVPAAED